MTIIDDYIKQFTPSQKKELERIRSIAKKTVPEAEDTISYGMPTLKYKGKAFLGFDVHKNHIGIYPYGGEEIEVFKDRLKAYGLSKGAIRVPFDNPIPEKLLGEIITHRIERIQ